jgi:uncharacterized membrane-anchored protein YhcB (DUF1043 family)
MEEGTTPQFVLNPGTMLVIGGIMGVLTGAIGKLFQVLMESKDKQIKHLEDQLEDITRDRDNWRDEVHFIRKRD